MSDTGRARLPALPQVKVADNSMRSWMQAVTERLEVREGSRGNPSERAVTVRELEAVASKIPASSTAAAVTAPLDDQLKQSPVFKALQQQVDGLDTTTTSPNTAGVTASTPGIRVFIQAADPGAVGAGSFWVIP